jgi:hypothetical protein
MATYALRYNWINTVTGESRDTLVMTFHIAIEGVPTAAAALAEFVDAWSTTATLNSLMQGDYELDTVQVYDVAAGGPPIDEVLAASTDRLSPSGASGPQEVQICVTRWVGDSLGRPTKLGRWYFGPVAHGAMNAARPSSTNRQIILNFQEKLHNNLDLINYVPVVDSKGDLHVPRPIVQYSVDDAWDTQRRRGVDPTSEIILDMVP